MLTPLTSTRNGCNPERARGTIACGAKGHQGGNYLPPNGQSKIYMVKARLLKVQVSGFQRRRQRRVVVKLSQLVHCHQSSSTGPGRADLLSIREIKGPNETPTYIVSPCNETLGLPKLVPRFSSMISMATEPPYYSRLACNGLSRQVIDLYRHGYKNAAMWSKVPLSGRKGGSSISGRSRKGGYADATRSTE